MDTCFNYVDKDKGFFSSDEQKWINRIHKLKEQFPDDVHIIWEPYENDGCIYCQIPTSWLKIQPKRSGRQLTEEERMAAVERLKRGREAKASSELQ